MSWGSRTTDEGLHESPTERVAGGHRQLVAAGLVVPLPASAAAPGDGPGGGSGHGPGHGHGYARAQPKPAEQQAPPPPLIVLSDPLAVIPGTVTKLKLRGLQLDPITPMSVGVPPVPAASPRVA